MTFLKACFARNRRLWRISTLCLLLLPIWTTARADEGEAHVSETASELFELLAVLRGGEWIFYLDDYASNAPVVAAQLEIDGAGVRGVAGEISPGVYRMAATPLAPGTHGITVSVSTESAADLLLLSLVIAEPEAVDGVRRSAGLLWVATALLVFVLLLVAAGLYRRVQRTAHLRSHAG